jgi:large subunit ribosomal protein L17
MQQRKAFIKGLLTALIEHGRIKTTGARGKTLKSEADRLITRAKKGTLASRRILLRHVGPKAAAKMAKEIAPKFADRAGGYTRLVRLGRRLSDGSEVCIVEFVQ